MKNRRGGSGSWLWAPGTLKPALLGHTHSDTDMCSASHSPRPAGWLALDSHPGVSQESQTVKFLPERARESRGRVSQTGLLPISYLNCEPILSTAKITVINAIY